MNQGSQGSERAQAVRRRTRPAGRTRWIVGVGAALLGAAVTLLAVYSGLFGSSGDGPTILQPLASGAPEVTLYFADPRWTRLVPEQRALRLPGDGAARIRGLVEALAEGPKQAGAPVLPKTAKLRGTYLGRNGLAVVDFEPEIAEVASGGASGELLTVYALVHTITKNLPEVQTVQLLVAGQERESLAGHVKISEPLRPEPELITSATAR